MQSACGKIRNDVYKPNNNPSTITQKQKIVAYLRGATLRLWRSLGTTKLVLVSDFVTTGIRDDLHANTAAACENTCEDAL